MNPQQLLRFFTIQRHVFGVCPNTGRVFRLSDCQVYTRKKPVPDWLDLIEHKQQLIAKANEKLDEQEEEIRERSRVEGRKQADKVVRKIDRIFKPMRLNPDDSKVVFHPVDFVVFNGMKSGHIKNLVLLDREGAGKDTKLQDSIGNTVAKGNYEWVTLRVEDDGTIKSE